MNSVVTKWLDKNYGDLRKHPSPSNNYFIHYKNKNDKLIFLFNRNTDWVTITDNIFYQYLNNIFSLSIHELNDILIPWFEQSYNLHVEKVQYNNLH